MLDRQVTCQDEKGDIVIAADIAMAAIASGLGSETENALGFAGLGI